MAVPARVPVPLLLAVVVLLALVPGAAARADPPPAAGPTPGQSTYTPVAPLRLLDTRGGERLGPGGTRALPVTGVGGVPADATAVVLSVTALAPTVSTDVQVYPGPDPQGSSNLAVVRGGTAANLVTVAVGPGGRVVLRNGGGSVDLLADLAGYYREGPGATFVAAAPTRLLDTRTDRSAVGPGEVRLLRVTGGAVPAGATAVALNVTAVGATRSTDLRVYPAGPGEPPTVSSSNPGPGRPTAVAVVAGVGEGGQVALRNGAGTVHLVVDVTGWFLPDGAGAGVLHPLVPRRLLDTRTAGGPVGPEGVRDVVVAGPGQVPAQATAVVLTVTAVGATRGTDVRVYPLPADGRSLPPSSTLNPGPGSLVSDSVLTGVGRDGTVRLRNAAGDVHLVVDLAGWFGPSGTGWDLSWPQCTAAGATTSRHPDGGAFAVVGVTRGQPFTDNECLSSEWTWASGLPGEPAVYLNVDAPGSASPHWTDPGPKACSGASTDPGCGYDYGLSLATWAAQRVPATPSGGRPFVWLDVEGGPAWQAGPSAVAVNRAVLDGAAQGLRRAGLSRYGVYTDAEPRPRNDWVQIMGERRLPDLPLWVFASTDNGSRALCRLPDGSVPGGPVQLVQRRASSPEVDVDDAC